VDDSCPQGPHGFLRNVGRYFPTTVSQSSFLQLEEGGVEDGGSLVGDNGGITKIFSPGYEPGELISPSDFPKGLGFTDLQDDLVVDHYWGGQTEEFGRWGTTTQYNDVTTARNALGIGNWNSMENVDRVIIGQALES